ncbi:hypothetical protein [Halomonas denitrificans]|nr:hypothetical protein [Halomonas denitrificans]
MHQVNARTPMHLWIVGILSLLWNAMGAFDYLATKLRLEFYMNMFTEAQLAYFYDLPLFFTVFWAVGVWGALFGSVALLLRRRWAVALFALSLVGMIVGSIYTLFLSDGIEIMGAGGAIFSAVIFVVGVFLLVYARRMAAAGVLR